MQCVLKFILQVGNGVLGNDVEKYGNESGLKLSVEFYHGHALFSDVRNIHVYMQ